MSHTPGQWYVGNKQRPSGTPFAANRVWSGDRPIAMLISDSAQPADIDPETQANARLIAAAPDLLEALQLVVDTYGFDSSTDSAIWQTACAAIAKAEGKQ
jgi:hypothetical protein